MPKYVLLYESADDVRSKAPLHSPAHVARWKTFQDQGTLLMIGTFGNPQEEGSMAIFTTREAAEAFCQERPLRPERGGTPLVHSRMERSDRRLVRERTRRR